ncbi:MAG: GAF domain-containing protein [Lentisphaerae bacterium]|nr:GAF domain-containing protein [Lentisphaerota bacterium]
MNATLSPEIPVLQEITRALVKEKNVRTLLETVLEILRRKMGMLRGTFTLLEGDELVIEASTEELNAEEKSLGHYHLGEGITGSVARSGRAEIVRDIRSDRRFLNRTGARDKSGAISFICVPLVHLGQVIGTLSVDRELGAGDDADAALKKDVALLEIIANITADAAAVCREQCAERDALADENRRLREILGGNPGAMVGNCREMRAVYEQIRQVAPSNATVLIRGASGTGKELVARAIQSASHRRDKPFIVFNCAALPENLIESELFGHEKGAFTDASSRRIGRAEAADGGTLFLDEIGDLSIPTQVKLLRFLQERTFSRVGSNEELHSDVRFIAATSRNLEDLMAKKLFREDLYYRLSVFPITIPDLSQRTGDIVLLAEHFIEKMNLKYGKNVKRISPPAVNMLLSYKWPGNVRELENCMERAILTATDDCVHGYNLPPSLQVPEFEENMYAPESGMRLEDQLAAFEKRVLEETIRRHNGNRSAAGRELGVSPRMMNYRLNKLGVTDV